MNLKEIFQQSKGVLSHAELNFYLGFVAFADSDTGFCYPKISTVANTIGILPQSASRLFKKLRSINWIIETENGYFCAVGFGETKPDVNNPDTDTTKPSVNNSKPQETKQDVNKTKHCVNTTKQGVKSYNKDLLTNHLTNHLTNQKSNVAVEIFNYWVKVCMNGNGNTVFNSKRKLAVEARLKENYTVDDIKAAIDGCNITPHNNGQNDTGGIFKDLELICRNGSNVERFRQNWENREHLQAKAIIKHGVKYGSTQTNQNGQKQERLNAIIEDSARFVSPAIN